MPSTIAAAIVRTTRIRRSPPSATRLRPAPWRAPPSPSRHTSRQTTTTTAARIVAGTLRVPSAPRGPQRTERGGRHTECACYLGHTPTAPRSCKRSASNRASPIGRATANIKFDAIAKAGPQPGIGPKQPPPQDDRSSSEVPTRQQRRRKSRRQLRGAKQSGTKSSPANRTRPACRAAGES